MKKKFFLIIIILLIFFLGINGYAEQVVVNTNGGEQSCIGLFGPLLNELKDILDTIHLLVPILLLLLTSFDFAKVVFADNKDGLNKAKNNFLKRCVAALIVFFAPDLLIMILTLVNEGDISSCIEEMQNNNRYQFVEQNNNQTPQNSVINQNPTIGQGSTELRIYDKNVMLNVGATKKITWDIIPINSNDTVKYWQSDNPNVVTVDNNGVLKAISKGNAKVTGYTSNGTVGESYVTVVEDEIVISNVSYNSGSSLYVGSFLGVEIEVRPNYDRIYFCTGSCTINKDSILSAQEISAYGYLGNGYIKPNNNNVIYYYKIDNTLSHTFYFDFDVGTTIYFAVGKESNGSIILSNTNDHYFDGNEIDY